MKAHQNLSPSSARSLSCLIHWSLALQYSEKGNIFIYSKCNLHSTKPTRSTIQLRRILDSRGQHHYDHQIPHLRRCRRCRKWFTDHDGWPLLPHSHDSICECFRCPVYVIVIIEGIVVANPTSRHRAQGGPRKGERIAQHLGHPD